MDGGGNAAEAGLARVVVPAQAEVVHPPNLWRVCDSDVDADGVEVLEAVVKGDWCEGTVGESGAGGDRDALGGYCGGVAGALVKTETSEAEVARRTPRIATKRCTVHVKAKAASEAMVTVADISRIAILGSVRSSHGVGAIDIKVGNELREQRLGRWQVWGSWWRNDNPSIGEVKLVIWIEDRLWLNIIRIGIRDAQRGNIIKLMEVSSLHKLWLRDNLQSE
jgi:hypothetical protein